MNENRSRSPWSSAWSLSRPVSLIVLLPWLLFAGGRKPEADLQADPLQKELLSRLSSGDEEQRLDAIERVGALWRNAPDSVVSSIVTALGNALQQDSSPLVRAFAAKALEHGSGYQGSGEAVPALIKALEKEREVAVRKEIIYALARYTQPQVTTSLIPILEDKNSELRAAAAYALAENGAAASAQALTKALQRRGKDEDAFARGHAARGLGRIGNRDSIDPLLEALKQDKSQEVRRECVQALGRIATRQDAKVMEALRDASRSNDPYLVSAADSALISINSRNH